MGLCMTQVFEVLRPGNLLLISLHVAFASENVAQYFPPFAPFALVRRWPPQSLRKSETSRPSKSSSQTSNAHFASVVSLNNTANESSCDNAICPLPLIPAMLVRIQAGNESKHLQMLGFDEGAQGSVFIHHACCQD